MSETTTNFDFTDKVVLITGGSRGLGHAMALAFARAGADIIVASRKLESCEETGEALFDKVIDVNLKGPFRLSALIGSEMQAAGSGAIINISSVAAIRSTPETAPYAAAKSGLNVLTEAFVKEYGPAVRVNCIMCGAFHTDISKDWSHSEEFTKQAKATYALQRAGNPEEVVGAALNLASDAASYNTGAILKVDGGATCGDAP